MHDATGEGGILIDVAYDGVIVLHWKAIAPSHATLTGEGGLNDVAYDGVIVLH